MSLIPIVLDLLDCQRDPFFRANRSNPGFYPDELEQLMQFPRHFGPLACPRWNYWLAPPRSDNELGSATITGKDGFQVCIDVQQFKPSEIVVKTVDNSVVVEAKHEERRDDHGYIARHFVRKYTLPRGYDAKTVFSTLSSDGVLTVKAPLPSDNAIEGNERVVQIQQTGPAHLNVKANPKEGSPMEAVEH